MIISISIQSYTDGTAMEKCTHSPNACDKKVKAFSFEQKICWNVFFTCSRHLFSSVYDTTRTFCSSLDMRHILSLTPASSLLRLETTCAMSNQGRLSSITFFGSEQQGFFLLSKVSIVINTYLVKDIIMKKFQHVAIAIF